jgi:UMF1 family MFS transporter
MKLKLNVSKPEWGWAMYDWANSAYTTTVITALFPIFYKTYWTKAADVTTSTFQLGTAHAVLNLILALFSPIMGAFADRGQGKKALLFLFTFIGVLATAALPMIEAGHWQAALLFFMIGNLGFTAGNSMYDSLLVSVAKRKDMEFVSALGYSLGYLGGGLLFLFNVLCIMHPETFGLADKAAATKLAFATVAIWWAVFSIPIFLWVPENPPGETKQEPPTTLGAAIRGGFKQLIGTFNHIKQFENLWLFLLAYFFYIDGVGTIIKMAVDYGLSIGLKQESLILSILVVQFVGFPATLVFSWLANKTTPKTALMVTIGAYMCGTVYAYFMHTEKEFMAMAILIGLVQGGIQSISRAVFGRMVPAGQAGEFFGFYNMLGKFSAIMGPQLIAIVAYFSRDSRVSILSVLVLFIIGAAILTKVKIPNNDRAS